MAVVGHCFPVWLKFRGGKGVATCVATFAAFDIRLGIVFVILWLGTAQPPAIRPSPRWWRPWGAASPLSGCTADAGCRCRHHHERHQLGQHHENIGRLLTGQESRIGKK